MVNWWGAGNQGPRNRREMQAAYSMLSEDTVALHGELGRARLDTVRLGAMVEVMTNETGRLRGELGATRAELAALRQRDAPVDPLVILMARQSSEMRAQLVENQRTIAELTNRLTDLLEAHLDAATARTAPRRIEPAAPARSTVAAGGEAAASAGRHATAPSPVADLRQPETAAAGERLRLIRRALDT